VPAATDDGNGQSEQRYAQTGHHLTTAQDVRQVKERQLTSPLRNRAARIIREWVGFPSAIAKRLRCRPST
jgi:hypothetical protein